MAGYAPVVHLQKPPYIVDAGPCPGVYFDKDGWELTCRLKGFDPFSPTDKIFQPGVKKDKPGFIVSIGGKHFIKDTARFGLSYGRVILTKNRDRAKIWRKEKSALRTWAIITHRMGFDGDKLPPGPLEVEPE